MSPVVRYNSTGTWDEILVPGLPVSGLRGVDFDFTNDGAGIEGSYGTDSSGTTERLDDDVNTTCTVNLDQDLGDRCD